MTRGGELDADAICADAVASTGLQDFGGDEVLSRFRKLVAVVSLVPGARSDPDGAAAMLRWIFVERLRFVDDRNRYPGLLEQPVSAPIVVMGLARSGTTLLHALLAEDEANRAPRYWEVAHPSPPPSLAGADDPRIRQADREIEDILEKHPEMLRAHPYFDMGGATFMECEHFWETPPFFRGFLSNELRDRYAFHREVLQHLQWGDAQRRRWVLKGAMHQYRLAEIRETYPDAFLVWIHRDPAKVVASQIRFLEIGAALNASESHRREKVFRGVDDLRERLDAAMASPHVDGDRICHVLYSDLVTDAVGVLRSLYDRFDLGFTESFASSVEAWFRDPRNRPDRHGKFVYPCDPEGLSSRELDVKFADYRDRFGIPKEV